MSSIASSLSATATSTSASRDTSTMEGSTVNNTGFNSLFEYPTTLMCSKCASVIAIPANMWYWTCSNGHPDNIRSYACKTCKEPCPHNLPWPAVECAICKTTTTVPSTEVAALIKGGIYSIRSAVNSIIEGPKTFHCLHCNILLIVPKGSWKCSACETMNTEHEHHCPKCSQDRYEQSVLCGNCGKSTTIPKSGLIDSLRAGLTELGQGMHRTWLDVMGQPHVDCPKCSNPVSLPTNIGANTVVNCGKCAQAFHVTHASASLPREHENYVRLEAQPIPRKTSKSSNPKDLRINDALSTIDQVTGEFSQAPQASDSTANPQPSAPEDYSAAKVTFEQTNANDKEKETDLLNSFANTA